MAIHDGKKIRTIYYKYDDVNWTQPVLTANGTMGGSSFACTQSDYYTESDGRKQEAWRMFSSSNAEEWQINDVSTSKTYWASWYNPKPLKISKLQVVNSKDAQFSPTKLVLEGSNDNSSWTTLGTTNNSNVTANSTWDATISSTGWYKYYRIVVTPRVGTAVMVNKLKITALVRNGVKEGTASDYDYTVFEDGKIKNVYKGSSQIILAYKGSQLIYSVYPIGGTVFEKSAAGTYTFTPQATGTYEISLVGGGGGGACAGDQPSYASKSRAGGGGSGAYVCGVWKLTKGTSYSITVGAGGAAGPSNQNDSTGSAGGTSSFASYITCTGGGGGDAHWKGAGTGGAAGTVTNCTGYTRLITSTDGNAGAGASSYNVAAGGAARLGSYGAGGSGQATGNYAGVTYAGNAGYCKIRFLVE